VLTAAAVEYRDRNGVHVNSLRAIRPANALGRRGLRSGDFMGTISDVGTITLLKAQTDKAINRQIAYPTYLTRIRRHWPPSTTHFLPSTA
jgi:hypothetical protein